MVASLFKKLFCKKDYVEIIPTKNPEHDKEKINSFLENIRREKGRIIRIQGMEDIFSSHADGQYSIEGNFTNSENSYLIHYKCYKQIKN